MQLIYRIIRFIVNNHAIPTFRSVGKDCVRELSREFKLFKQEFSFFFIGDGFLKLIINEILNFN